MLLQQRYNQVQNGEFSKSDFLKEAREDSRINKLFSHLNTYEEVVHKFKQKGYIVEAVQESDTKEFNFTSMLKESALALDLVDEFAKEVQQVNPFEYEKGWRIEANGKDLSDDKVIIAAQKKAIKNLHKDPIYYTKIEMGKWAPTKKDIDSRKMLDISKGKNLTDPNNQMKPVSVIKPSPKEDEDRVKIEKIKTELLEGLKKKNSSQVQINEGTWENLKYAAAQFHQFKPGSKKAKELKDTLQKNSEKGVQEVLKKIEAEIKKVSPEFPNNRTNEEFQEGLKEIAFAIDSITASGKLNPTDEKYIDPTLANKMLSGIDDYIDHTIDHDLAHTYKVFKESLNENVTVSAGEGITQLLQKMSGINLGASQNVTNLKSAIEKVGDGNYDKGLEVIKKLFTNNGAGSINQQADRLTDIISKGGKIGDAFTKVQGTFGNKGLFSIKLPPDTTEKILNTVAKVANKASQIANSSNTIKHVAKAVKHSVGHFSDITDAHAIALILGSLAATGLAFAYVRGREFGDNREKALNGLKSKIKMLSAGDLPFWDSETNTNSKVSATEPEQISKPVELTPTDTSKEEKPKKDEEKKSGVTYTPPGQKLQTFTPEKEEEKSSSISVIKPDGNKKPVVHTPKKEEEPEKKSSVTAISPKDFKSNTAHTPLGTKPTVSVIKPGDNKPKKTFTPSDNKVADKGKEEIPYGKPVRYKASIMKQKPKESITIPGEKDEKGKWVRRDIVLQVAPELKNYYNEELKKKTSRLVKSIDKFKKKVEASVKQFPILVNLKDESTEEKFINALNKVKIDKSLNESFIVEAMKDKLLEDLYTPSLGMFVPYPKGRMVDKDDLERELRNNTPADNQDYTDSISVYTGRIDGERLSKIDQIVKQMGQPGIDLYNKYAEENGCEPYTGKAKSFNPVIPSDDKEKTYTDGDGKKQPVKDTQGDVFEADKPNFAPAAQGFLQTLNDIYKRCVPKTGLRPFVEHIMNSKLDSDKQEPKLVIAYIKHKLENGKPEHKEVLQRALQAVQTKYKQK